jgi:CRP-like cAMP-binding protein
MRKKMNSEISPRRILRKAFPGIREDEAFEMTAVGRVHNYPSGTVLCLEGAIESIFYILLDGHVEVTKAMQDMQSRVMKKLGPGEFFGEMALIHNMPRSATVTSLTPVTVLEIHKEDFTHLLEHCTPVSLAMVREVSRRLRQNDQMAIEDLRVKAGELAYAYQTLAEMEFARSEFLTTIAHELRTPLTSAGGFLQLIQKGMLQGQVLNSALDHVTKNIQEIIALVNDILFIQ